MNASRLYCISPIDGRYAKYSTPLSGFFSEFGLIKYRLFVEIEYFKQLVQMHLVGLENFPIEKLTDLDAIVSEFSEQDAIAIKQIEATTNHDIKAVEYFIKSRFEVLSIAQYKEFVHFGLTSQDINNTAIPLSLKHGLEQVILP
ncbi:MAG TPA: adenylosuccinate lyase, partial [Bacteroidales bacterium]|nr:adenylosuccinate lyase [Bacteroidales bacterium]